MPDAVLVERPRPQVAVIRLNRPEKLNAMNIDLVDGIHDALDEVDADNDIRVVILTGAGRGFCSGADLTGFGEVPGTDDLGPVPTMFRHQQRIVRLIPRMRALRKPIIAAVNGAAAGGGLALVCGSDVRLASDTARFSAAFVRIGLSGCDIGVSWTLPRLIGASRAHLMMLTGRLIDAETAERWGLVAEVLPGDELLAAAHRVADELLHNSPMGLWMTKEVMWSNLEVPGMQAGIDLENRTQVLCGQTGDCREAMDAFAQKRDPNFQYG